MTTTPTPEIRRIGRSWCITAGKARLARHGSQADAQRDLDANRALYQYWAGSAGVSIENQPPQRVLL